MEHKVLLNEISDGKLYSQNDSVLLSCDGCRGAAECCCFAEDTITLDPFDFYQFLQAGLRDFTSMYQRGYLSLSPENGLLLPHLCFQKESNRCPFLTKEGRCQIHCHRPGLCRLFPLARIFKGDKLYYILQIHECSLIKNATSQQTVKDWLAVTDPEQYERFLLCWHRLLQTVREKLSAAISQEKLSSLTTSFLSVFYQLPYQAASDFYSQFAEREKYFRQTHFGALPSDCPF